VQKHVNNQADSFERRRGTEPISVERETLFVKFRPGIVTNSASP